MMKHCADSILDDLMESLREDRVRAAIEIPIDRSVECYNFPTHPPLTYHQQLHQLADFVRHIYANGLTLPPDPESGGKPAPKQSIYWREGIRERFPMDSPPR